MCTQQLGLWREGPWHVGKALGADAIGAEPGEDLEKVLSHLASLSSRPVLFLSRPLRALLLDELPYLADTISWGPCPL